MSKGDKIGTSKKEASFGEAANTDLASPNEEQQTINLPAGQASYNLETDNMEVHHHPHVEKKNFKEYLLEGLMIFVAVTLGFFAETIRESISEHERAGIYAASMLQDSSRYCSIEIVQGIF